jgi:RNA recognition motif-containing protein
MSFTVFLGNLPIWVTADDIKQWLSAEDLVADSVKVIRNHETQESKGFAFIEAPTSDEMQAIIRRFDRAPLEDKVLRANPAQPSKGTPAAAVKGPGAGNTAVKPEQRTNGQLTNGASATATNRPVERRTAKKREQEPKSAFATELAKVL